MAIDTTSLKSSIKTLLDTLKQNTTSQDAAIDQFCNDLTSYLEVWVKTATVTIPSGYVLVSGTATNQSNAAPIVVANALS